MATAFGGTDIYGFLRGILRGSMAGEQMEMREAQERSGIPASEYQGWTGGESQENLNNTPVVSEPIQTKSDNPVIQSVLDNSTIKAEETPADSQEVQIISPSESTTLWGTTYVPEGGKVPEGKTNVGTFSATGVVPQSKLKEGVKYNIYETPGPKDEEGDLANKIKRFRDIAISKIGYDPDTINPTKQAFEDFTKDLPDLFRHVFQGNAVWNNLTPDQAKYWESIKSQYIARKVKEYETTKKDGSELLNSMMTMFSQEMGREAGTKTVAPGSYIIDKSGKVISKVPEKAEKLTVSDIKSAYTMEMNGVKQRIALDLKSSPEDVQSLSTQAPENIYAMLLSGSFKTLSPEKKQEYMDEIKKIEDYYKQLMEVALGKKGAAPKGGEAGEGMAQNPAQGGIMNEMPPAQQYSGKIIKDTTTGKRYKSDGKAWMEIK